MVVNHNGSSVSVAGDSRITPFGAKLRHYKIDELPELWDERLSLAQNIDRLLFNPNGQLYNEFTILYRSLFKDSEAYVKVVECLNERGYGMMRSEIADATGMKSGKSLTTILDNLESCGFIRKYVNYGCSTRKSHIYPYKYRVLYNLHALHLSWEI